MIALRLRFPAGRYHATPWGRHVNEAGLPWPPEPLRILRALIACHHRKADKDMFSEDALAELIDALADRLPIYRLPEAVQAHTRHYMPSPVKTTLVFDAFARFDPEEPLIVGWPGVALSPEQRAHLDHLAVRLGYLGRAESWIEAAVVEWDGRNTNAQPARESDDGHDDGRAARSSDSRLVSLYAPLSSDAYRKRRERLTREEREHRRTNWAKKSKPTDTALDKDMEDFCATLPERLVHALAVDTSDLHSVGWNDPPATRRVLYAAPELAAAWHGQRRQRPMHTQAGPAVARFVLAGRPLPRVEDTLRIAEIARLALMSRFKGRRPPLELSGRDDNGPLRGDPAHAHAFYLPEDADGDGLIDHVIVYCRQGFSGEARRALDSLTRLWTEHGRADEEGERGRKEWRVALEDIAAPEAFAAASGLLRGARRWRSVTPFLKSRFDKGRPHSFDALVESYRRQIIGEWTKRFPDLSPPAVEPIVDAANASRFIIRARGDRPLSTLAFARTRRGRGGRQPDTSGGFFQLTFDRSVSGPISLGWGAHFGLGLFTAMELSDSG